MMTSATASMQGLEHVGFTVKELDRSIRFYSQLLQCEPVVRRMQREQFVADAVGYAEVDLEVAFFQLPGGSVALELIEYRKPGGRRVDMETYNTGNAHLCLLVKDLDGEFDRLRLLGASFRHKRPVDLPIGDEKLGKTVYLRDPDGISIQLLEMPDGTSRFTSEKPNDRSRD